MRPLVAAFIFNQAQRVWTSLPAPFVSGRVDRESGTELPHSKRALGVRPLVAAFIFNQAQRVWTSLPAPFVSGRVERESGTELPHSKRAPRGLWECGHSSPLSFSTRPSAFGRPCPRRSCPAVWKEKAVPSYRTPRGLQEGFGSAATRRRFHFQPGPARLDVLARAVRVRPCGKRKRHRASLATAAPSTSHVPAAGRSAPSRVNCRRLCARVPTGCLSRD